ncbi:MAG TPA: glycoside hydrolase family 97 catalytic domain-containing protein [Arachidicoccus sp.]|nr:glycoside hydrolase family 97 catalytic domain-containing protein [Arachidicoccus sp.]
MKKSKAIIQKAFWLLLTVCPNLLLAKDYKLASPNGHNVITITCDQGIGFKVTNNQSAILAVQHLKLVLEATSLGVNPVIIREDRREIDKMIDVDIPTKFKEIHDNYNQLELTFKGDYSIIFRAYDNGVAYRFVSRLDKPKIKVKAEGMSFNVFNAHNTIWPYEAEKHDNSFLSHFEYLFKNINYTDIDSTAVGLPLYLTAQNDAKVIFTESDLFDYPNLFIQKSDQLNAVFPLVIESQQQVGDRSIKILKKADYIAETKGTREFPWRLWMINEDDASVLRNTLVYQLATPSKIAQTDWIHPGKVAWDWWNDNNITGVDFKSGINNDTYKYYIDFASEFGLDYILLDEGWTKSTLDLTHPNPQIDVPMLVEYAKKKHVGVILWVLWNPLDKDMNKILDLYKSWGVKGIKVDFMARAEQYMVNFYTRTAIACADRHLMVDFHGAYKPTGLERTYPNVISFESVHGLENDKWESTITPGHDVTLPFTRMVAGPMDYTPGAMHNVVKKNFFPAFSQPMSMGTRAHQTALYVLFESPLQMLADNPSNYLKEKDYTTYLSKFPTTWDDLRVLYADAGKAVILARRKGNLWYLGGITNWDPFNHPVKLDFLGKGKYQMELLKDGINADRAAEDYKLVHKSVDASTSLSVPMAPGGGFSAIFTPVQNE